MGVDRPFALQAASAPWLEAMVARHAAEPGSLPPDWRAALDLVATFFPHALHGAGGEGFSGRFGHLAADLDPLSLPLPPRWAALRAAANAAQGPDGAAAPWAVETGHLDDPARIAWIEARFAGLAPASPETLLRAWAALIRAETFETFMAKRFPGRKRFGAEGAETLHVLVGRILDRAAATGVEEVVVAPNHRGRLGLMACLFGEDPARQFARMKGAHPLADASRAGDVPYHMGVEATYAAPAGPLRIRVLPNPSHLEAVNAVALGFARRRQEELGGAGKVLPLVLHTDASVAAQGVVAEMLQFSEVDGHGVGGSLHVVVDNQVGFTTDPHEARSSRWCTGAFKAVDSLIVHVNGDRPEAVLAAADLACDHRLAWAGVGVVRLSCVRENGHNELDEPRFTQPNYVERAQGRPSVVAGFSARLEAQGVVAAGRAAQVGATWRDALEAASASGASAIEPAIAGRPPEFRAPAAAREIAERAARAPPGDFNPKAVRLVAARLEEFQRDEVSWATAEMLALGAALSTGRDVRLTGQDVERGPFSQRHLALVGPTGAKARVFDDAPPGWGRLTVRNTPLSEYFALGFAYGWSVAAPDALTIWEAQFGDFANVAQPVFDQFIASAAEKWGQRSGLVVLLPHGLEGQGPEHSSARIERLLQLCARDNLRLAQPSTPASHHHLLLSQVTREETKPLLVITPKKLLRLKAAVSAQADFASACGFAPLLVSPSKGRPRRALVCSGKVFYDLAAARGAAGVAGDDLAILRLEQLYPFPATELGAWFAANVGTELAWVQEEPENFGAWSWLRPRLEALAGRPVEGVCRPESPSPAGSFHGDHEDDQARLVARALTAGRRVGRRRRA